MDETIIKRYGLDAIATSLPADRAELYARFRPWPEDLQGFVRASAQTIPRSPALGQSMAWQATVSAHRVKTSAAPNVPPTTRSIWDATEKDGRRVLIEIDESSSELEAIEALADRLAWNELAMLDRGPKDLGRLSFTHPKGVPPATLFVRGNLCISVASFGSRPVDATDIAHRLDARLRVRPSQARESIRVTKEAPDLVAYEPTWAMGDDGFVAIDVAGGRSIHLLEERKLVIAPTSNQIHVTIHVLEPGHEPHVGSLSFAPVP